MPEMANAALKEEERLDKPGRAAVSPGGKTVGTVGPKAGKVGDLRARARARALATIAGKLDTMPAIAQVVKKAA